jgi:hypothetical protein
MSLRQRFGTLFLFAAAIALFIFVSSLFADDRWSAFSSLGIGMVLLVFGWILRFNAPKPPAAPPPAPAAPARGPERDGPKPGFNLGNMLKLPQRKKKPD